MSKYTPPSTKKRLGRKSHVINFLSRTANITPFGYSRSHSFGGTRGPNTAGTGLLSALLFRVRVTGSSIRELVRASARLRGDGSWEFGNSFRPPNGT